MKKALLICVIPMSSNRPKIDFKNEKIYQDWGFNLAKREVHVERDFITLF